MRTKLSEIYAANLLGALAKGDARPKEETLLEETQRIGVGQVANSDLIPAPEDPEAIGGKGSGTTDYAEGEPNQEDKEATRE